jgi:hypothetical protein
MEGVKARVERDQTCYGPGDTVTLRIYVMSSRIEPVKLKSVAFSVRETITYRGAKANRLSSLGASGASGNKAASQRTEAVAQKSKAHGKKLYKGEEQFFELACVIPKSHALMTVQTAKHIEVSYTLRVYVDVSKAPIVIDHLPLTVSAFPSSVSLDTVRRIGYVPGLSLPAPQAQQSARKPQQRQGTASTTTSGGMGMGMGMARSQSFSSSTAAPFALPGRSGSGDVLRRRDTVMTQGTASTGPGMAGRGVPGQIFSWGQLGSAQAYDAFAHQHQQSHSSAGMGQPVRPAFAGPASIYEGNVLHEEENRALFHHANQATAAQMLGVDQDSLSGPGVWAAGSRFSHSPRSESPAQMARFEPIAEGVPLAPNPHASPIASPSPVLGGAGASSGSALAAQQEQLLRFASARSISRPASVVGAASTTNASEAEAEKMRLYEHARLQAERNQRRADEKRAAQAAALAAGGGAAGMPTSRSAGHLSNSAAGAAAAPTAGGSRVFSAPTASDSAHNEKRLLYERARREAERYQSSFEQGASFPRDEALVDPAHAAAPLGLSAAPKPALRVGVGLSQAEQEAEERRRSSAKYWIDSPHVDIAAANAPAPRQSVIGGAHPSQPAAASSSSSSAHMSAPSTSAHHAAPSHSYPTAEEEKRSLYERARAQQAEAEAQAHAESVAAASAAAMSTAPTSSSAMAAASGSSSSSRAAAVAPATTSYPSAEEEKRRLYEAARAEQEAVESEAHARSVAQAAAALRSPLDNVSSQWPAPDSAPPVLDEIASSPAGPSTAAPSAAPGFTFSVSSPVGAGAGSSSLGPSFLPNTTASLSPLSAAPVVDVSPMSTPALPSASSAAPAPFAGAGGPSTSRAPPPAAPLTTHSSQQAHDEKESVRLYYAALKARANGTSAAATSSTPAAASSTPAQAQTSSLAGPALARPAASYAAGYSRAGEIAAPVPQAPAPPVSQMPSMQRHQAPAVTPRPVSYAAPPLPVGAPSYAAPAAHPASQTAARPVSSPAAAAHAQVYSSAHAYAPQQPPTSHLASASSASSDLPHLDASVAAGKQRSMSPRIDGPSSSNGYPSNGALGGAGGGMASLGAALPEMRAFTPFRSMRPCRRLRLLLHCRDTRRSSLRRDTRRAGMTRGRRMRRRRLLLPRCRRRCRPRFPCRLVPKPRALARRREWVTRAKQKPQCPCPPSVHHILSTPWPWRAVRAPRRDSGSQGVRCDARALALAAGRHGGGCTRACA